MSTHVDGRAQRADLRVRADVAVVGSGPAGAAAARAAAERGAKVIVLEAGPWLGPPDFALDSFSAMADGYRALGASVVAGSAPLPFVQGRMVGGSSPINGAICWRLPEDVHAEWVRADPALREALPWRVLEEVTDHFEERLGVAPTDPAVAGAKNLLMARGAEALGLAHRPIRRNVRRCEGRGRCLQGCPVGAKQSVDATLLADAMAAGTRVLCSTEVARVEVRGARATGVVGRTAAGARVTVDASAVVLAASAVQTPALLLASGLRQGPVGRHFQCHPGLSVAGRFPEPVRMWEGATQGHEVTGLRAEGLKFEALGFGPEVLAGRLPGVGTALARRVAELAHWVDWGVAVRARSEGRVRLVGGRPVVQLSLGGEDLAAFRRGLRVLAELLLAAGATEVAPGVRGAPETIHDARGLAALAEVRPARAYAGAITHMFGTCRMGSDPASSVVRPDFRHHRVAGLYVADSSVFPTNLGVNPQIPIMALATLAGRHATGGLP